MCSLIMLKISLNNYNTTHMDFGAKKSVYFQIILKLIDKNEIRFFATVIVERYLLF